MSCSIINDVFYKQNLRHETIGLDSHIAPCASCSMIRKCFIVQFPALINEDDKFSPMYWQRIIKGLFSLSLSASIQWIIEDGKSIFPPFEFIFFSLTSHEFLTGKLSLNPTNQISNRQKETTTLTRLLDASPYLNKRKQTKEVPIEHELLLSNNAIRCSFYWLVHHEILEDKRQKK